MLAGHIYQGVEVKYIVPLTRYIPMARILANDGLDSSCIEYLLDRGHVVVSDRVGEEDVQNGALSGFDCIIVRSATKLNSDAITANSGSESKLKLIIRAGVGLDNIDLEAAESCGIDVRNTPAASTNAVVEFTIAHLLTGIRMISRADRDLRGNKWTKGLLRGSELSGKNLGLVGYGRIARNVANISRTFGMNVHTYDPLLLRNKIDDDNITIHDSIESLFTNCTHISIHCAKNDSTENIVNGDLIMLMPDKSPDGVLCGRHIVNCSRGGIMVEKDVYTLVESGFITSLGVDVFEKEPEGNPTLTALSNVTSTPHIGASTREAQLRIGWEVVDIIEDLLT